MWGQGSEEKGVATGMRRQVGRSHFNDIPKKKISQKGGSIGGGPIVLDLTH